MCLLLIIWKTTLFSKIKGCAISTCRSKLNRCCYFHDQTPKDDEELPKAGAKGAPKAVVELLKAGDEVAPNADMDPKGEEFAPNTLVEVPPKTDARVVEPNILRGSEKKKGIKVIQRHSRTDNK